MKKLTVNCKCGETGTFDTFDFYISEPNGRNPLYFQIWYLTNMRGCMLQQFILTAINDLLKLSRETNSSFEELMYIAFPKANESSADIDKPNSVVIEKPDDKDKPKRIDPEIKFLFDDNNENNNFPDFFNTYENECKKEMEKGSSNHTAAYFLGNFENKKKNKEKSIEYFEKANKDPRAILMIAKKKNDDKNIEESLKLYLKAICLGELSALYSLLVCLDTRVAFHPELEKLKKEYENGLKYDDYEAMTILGILTLIFDENNKEKAISYFENASKYYYPSSFYFLGLMYERGLGNIEPDIKKAVNYYQIGVKYNHVYSIHRLAMIYERGQSFYTHHEGKFLSGKEKLDENENQAIFYYEKATSQGSVMALESMAGYCIHGFYVKYDPDMAKTLAEKAIFCFSDETFLSEGVELKGLFTILSWYYYYEKKDVMKSLEYSLRALKESNKDDSLLIEVALCLKKIAKNKVGKEKEKLFNKTIDALKLALKINPQNGVANYQLGKFYLKGIYFEKNEAEAKKYLTDAFKRYDSRAQTDNDNSDSPAYYRLAKIAELNLIAELNGKANEYYTKAANATVKWFFIRVFQQKAQKKLSSWPANIQTAAPEIKAAEILVTSSKIAESKASETKAHVMISYASPTRDKVLLIQAALEKCGFTVWIDVKDMKNRIFTDMAFGIEKSSHVIACISEFYEKSRYCEKELSYAISSKKPIIPVIVQEGYRPKGWVGVAVSDVKYYKITNETELKEVFPAILERIDIEKFNELQSTVCIIS
jgi:TPR repeat protein